MRPTPWEEAEKYRLLGDEKYESVYGDNFGAFIIHRIFGNLRMLVSAGEKGKYAWEHVSVSLADRCPTWAEMDRAKKLFWLPEETVMQLHVPEREHINVHPYTLHLWRPIGFDIPLPPPIMV